MKNIKLCAVCIILCAMLSSCASLLPVKTLEVKVPVAVPCVQAMPEKPYFITDDELLAYDKGNFITALHVDRLQRQSYEAELEAVLAGCK